MLNKEEIKKIIPQREPFLMIDEVEEYIKQLEEAKQRDHRKIGAQLGVYMTHELVGPGFPLWLPNGSIIRRELENYIIDKEKKESYTWFFSSLHNCNLSICLTII